LAFLSRKPWLPESFTGIQEGIIQTAGLAICSTIYIRKALLTVRVKQESNQSFWKYIFSGLRGWFLAKKKRVNEQTR
jgi:hypothetical protein